MDPQLHEELLLFSVFVILQNLHCSPDFKFLQVVSQTEVSKHLASKEPAVHGIPSKNKKLKSHIIEKWRKIAITSTEAKK